MMLWMRSGRDPRRRWSLGLRSSLALSIWGVTRYPEMTFFLAPARIWELLAGSLLALGLCAPCTASVANSPGQPAWRSSWPASCSSTRERSFPGLNAVWPCLGAALIIHAEGSTTNRLLALRPFVFVGLVSYSLYLWHWPVIVFARYEGLFFGTLPARPSRSLPSACAGGRLLALRRGAVKRRRLLADPAAASLGGGCLDRWRRGGDRGSRGRLHAERCRDPRVSRSGAREARAAYGEGTCFFSDDALLSTIVPEKCLTRDPAQRTYLLIGDSFAAHLWPGLKEALPGADVLQFTFGGCPPLLTVAARGEPGCRKVVEAVAAAVEKTRFDAILLAANWKSGELDALADTLDVPEATDRRGRSLRPDGSLPQQPARHHPRKQRSEREVVKYRILPDADDRRMRRLSERLDVDYVSLVDLMCARTTASSTTGTGSPSSGTTGT